MHWHAHLVGGPLHGDVEPVVGYWPLLMVRRERDLLPYHLVCWVQVNGAIEPFTPLLYLSDTVPAEEALAVVKAYIAEDAAGRGLLADHHLTSCGWLAEREKITRTSSTATQGATDDRQGGAIATDNETLPIPTY